MIDLIEDSNFGMGPEEFGAHIPVTRQENFVNGVYSSLEEAIARELDRLLSEEGIIPRCKMGCCYCCRYHILMDIAEAHTLAQYVKRELSVDQINDLKKRTHQWHAWHDSGPGRYPPATVDKQIDISNYDHCCPLVVNGACIAYPVRPVVCRLYVVSSQPRLCRAVHDPELTEDAPVVLRSIVTATRQFPMAIRDHIENAGVDFSRSQMLLPQWLAIEMGWPFAISP